MRRYPREDVIHIHTFQLTRPVKDATDAVVSQGFDNKFQLTRPVKDAT